MTPLETWLAGAVHGLSADSAAQVRAEIQEHYQSAYEAALAGGDTTTEAEFRAVAALGNARSSNRQYRRVLLTVREAKHLYYMTVDPSYLPARQVTVGKWAARLLMAEATAGLVLASWKDQGWMYLSLAIVGTGLFFRFLPVDTRSRGRKYRWAKWIASLGTAGLAAWLRIGPAWLPLGLLIMPAYFRYVHASIRRKLPVNKWPAKLYR